MSEHVLYELQVLFAAAARLEEHTTRLGFNLAWLEHVTLVESFAVHARALVHFLFRDRDQRGVHKLDALATDYFAPGAWRSICPPPERYLEPVGPRVGREVAHLSYGRVGLAEEAKGWPFAQIAGSIGRPFRIFIDEVPEEHVIAGFRDRVRDAFPEYLRFPVAVSYPPDWFPPSTATRMADPPKRPPNR